MAERERRWLPLPVVFCAGVLLVVAMPALFFWFSVPHDALAQSFVAFPMLTVAGRHLPLPGPGSILAWHDFYLPLAVIVAAAFTFRQTAAAHRPTLVLLLTISLATLALAVQRLDTPHAYPAIMFSMALLSACLAMWQHKNRRLLPGLLLAGAIFCYGLVPLFVWTWQLAGPGEAVPGGVAPQDAGPYSKNQPPIEIARAGPIRLAFDQRQSVAYIQRHLAPGRPLYVGVATHGLQLFNDALFCFLADRPQATRFDMFVPGATNNAAVQSEILRAIRQEQTEYVVLFRAPVSHEPNLSSVDSGVRILDDAIRRDYTQVAEFGRYTIWHRSNL